MVGTVHAVLLLATEAGGEEAGTAVILPAAAELVYGFIAFVIVFVVLSRVAWPMIDQTLEDRRAAIQGRMEEADRALREADETKAEYRSRLDDARGEANRIIEDAKQTAESLRRDIVAKAESEAKAIVDRAQTEVAAERERTLQQMRSEVGTLAVQLAARIVEKELDPSTHRHLVDEYITRLSSSN